MNILQVKSQDGTWTGIPAIVGPAGKDGADATINGVNSLTLAQGDNITLSQQGSTLTISASGFATETFVNDAIATAIGNVLKEAF